MPPFTHQGGTAHLPVQKVKMTPPAGMLWQKSSQCWKGENQVAHQNP